MTCSRGSDNRLACKLAKRAFRLTQLLVHDGHTLDYGLWTMDYGLWTHTGLFIAQLHVASVQDAAEHSPQHLRFPQHLCYSCMSLVRG